MFTLNRFFNKIDFFYIKLLHIGIMNFTIRNAIFKIS